MTEDVNGGTPQESESTPAVFTEEQVKEMMEQHGKEVMTQVWSKFQSDKDKEVAEYRKEAEAVMSKLKEYEAAQEQSKVESMTPDERAAYYTQKMYERMQSSNSPSLPEGLGSTSPSAGGVPSPAPSTPSSSAPDAAEQAKQTLREMTKKAGLDPEQIDFNNGIEGYLKSVVNAVKPAEKTPEEKNAELEREKAANFTPPSGSNNSLEDIIKADPRDLIRKGAENTIRSFNTPR